MSAQAETPEELDRLGPEQSWADFRPMIVYLAAIGGILTLAARKDWTWAYVVGLVGALVWVLGFYVSRGRRERWFIW